MIKFQVVAKDANGASVKLGPALSKHRMAMNIIASHATDAEIIDAASGEVYTRVVFDENARQTVEVLRDAPVEDDEPEMMAMGPRTGKSHFKKVNW